MNRTCGGETALAARLSCTLPPVSFHQNIAAPSVSPAMRYPAGMWPRRLFPPARGPGVSVAIGRMVAGNPHMVAAGPVLPPLVLSMGRSDADHHLFSQGAEDQRARKHQTDQTF